MAGNSVVLCLVTHLMCHLGLQSTATEFVNGSFAIRTSINTTQPYVNSYTGWQEGTSRVRRAVNRIPQLDNRELMSSVMFAENQLKMMGRHEKNIMNSNIKVKLGSVLHGAYIESLPSSEALQHGKEALVALRASQHIGGKHCYRLGIDDTNCANQVSKVPLSPTTLGAKCADHYHHTVFCSELAKYRSFDGSCNHVHHPSWGQALTAYKRLLPAQYDDGFQSPRGSLLNKELPSVRLISTALSQNIDKPDKSVTLAALQWGQFIAEDMANTAVSKMWSTGDSIACCDNEGHKLSPRHIHSACFPIQISSRDPVLSKKYQSCMSYVRSLPAFRDDCNFGPLEQLNQASHLLDGSMMYGTSSEKAGVLRSGTFGRLRTVMKSGREFLPTIDTLNVNCHVGPNGTCYQTGDARINIQPHVAVMHTLWVREHNRIASKLATLNSHWSDEKLYQEARRIVIAEIQHITYNEWMPAILGLKYLRNEPLLQLKPVGHSGLFRDDVHPGVTNSFASAAMRALNSMVEDYVRLYNENRSPGLEPLSIHSFHTKDVMQADIQLDSLVRGLATQSAQKMDLHHSFRIQHKMFSLNSTVDDLGMDGFSLDIQRGRDHGLPSYNAFREKCGIRKSKDFSDLSDTIHPEIIASLLKVYKNVNDIDLLVGGMSEHTVDGLVGPVFKCIIGEQFKRTRQGDRYFYDHSAFIPGAFTERQLNEIKKVTLARIFCDNTNNVLTMQPYVFYKPVSPSNDLASCSESSRIRRMNFDPWFDKPPQSVLQGIR